MRLADVGETEAAGAVIAPLLMAGDVLALSGSLGAGKTSFARGLIRALGFLGEVPSPSFALVIPYVPPEVRLPIAHVDLYRLEDEAAIEELGLDEARSDGALLIEWPERLGNRLPADALQIGIAPTPDGARALTATVPPAWEARWPFR